jgi:phage portal protein BeeE
MVHSYIENLNQNPAGTYNNFFLKKGEKKRKKEKKKKRLLEAAPNVASNSKSFNFYFFKVLLKDIIKEYLIFY